MDFLTCKKKKKKCNQSVKINKIIVTSSIIVRDWPRTDGQTPKDV